MQIHNIISKFLKDANAKQPAINSNAEDPEVITSKQDDITPIKQTQYPQDKSIIHCLTSMVLFFILFVEALAMTAMEGCIIYYHALIFSHCDLSLRTLGLSQVDLVYHGIFTMSFIYQLFLYMDSIRQRNVFQLMMLLLYGILLVIFTGVQTIQHQIFTKIGCNFPPLVTAPGNPTTLPNYNNGSSESTKSLLRMAVVISNNTDRFQDTVDDYISNIKPFEYAVLVFVPICFLIMVGCMIKLYSLFRWNRYKAHTVVLLDKNDTRLRTTLLAWAVLTGLLKLDFFFLFSYAVQLVPSQLMEYTIPSYESIIVFFFGLAAFLLAIQATRTENTRLMWLLSLVILGSIGYFGYRLFTFGIPRDSTNDPYMLTRYSLLFTTLTLTLLMMITLCTCLVCIKNVSFHKIHISDTFHCTCPACYAIAFTINDRHQQEQQDGQIIKQGESSSNINNNINIITE